MPIYDYACESCGAEFEVLHPIDGKPGVPCPKCDSERMHKLISAPAIIVGKASVARKMADVTRRQSEMREDLRRNYGIENVSPLQRGANIETIHSEIKKQGDYVRDSMQARKEIDEAKRKAKTREWLKAAYKRVPERSRIMREHKLKEEAAKKAIKL